MQMEAWLSGGDLRSDGASDLVVDFVLANPIATTELVAALDSDDKVVRGRAADALEKVGHRRPQQVAPFFPEISDASLADTLPMVRWNLAMLLGYLLVVEERRVHIGELLQRMLADDSVFVLSWVITSLSLLALIEPERQAEIIAMIAPFQQSESAALKTRACKAMAALTDPAAQLSASWIKSPQIAALLHRGVQADGEAK